MSIFVVSTGQLINSMRVRCQAVVQANGSSTRYWALVICHWNQWTLMKSKISVTISIRIYANQSPCHFIFYAFVVVNVVTGSDWDEMVWVLFSNTHRSLFVCMFVQMFVCLQYTCLFESVLMFMLECITTKETLGNSFINREKKNVWLSILASFCSCESVTLPHISKHCTSM